MHSTFFTSYDRNDYLTRTSLVIVSSDYETKENRIGKKANFKFNDDFSYILNVLEERYNQTSNESLPYHYIITRDGIVHNLKPPLLSVPSKSALALYKNDCLILVICHELSTATENQITSLTELISNLSLEISVKITDTVFYPQTFVSNNIDKDLKDNIFVTAINKRNEKAPVMSLIEYVLPNNKVLANSELELLTTIQSDATLKMIGSHFGLPETILKELNPHIETYILGKYVFIPSTDAIKARKEALMNHKYLYSLSFLASQILKEGLNNEQDNR